MIVATAVANDSIVTIAIMNAAIDRNVIIVVPQLVTVTQDGGSPARHSASLE